MEKIINSFVNLVIEQKKLQFSIQEVTFDEQLFKNNILTLEADKISINDFQAISTHFVVKYKEKLNFDITDNFTTNVGFINWIRNDFTDSGYIYNYHTLEKEIWKLIIKESNHEFKCSFDDYLKSINLNNKSNEIFAFIEAYSEVLPELNLTENEILENAIILTEITKSDATYNMPLIKILMGIKNKVKSDYENGLKLLNISLTISDDKGDIMSSIVSGLYENKRNDFFESVLKTLIQEDIKTNYILVGLANVSEITISDCDLFVKVISDCGEKEKFLISKLTLVFSILKSNITKHHDFCFKELKLAIEDEGTAYHILKNLVFADDYNQEKTDIIIRLINQNYFTIEKYINLISEIFWHLKEFDSFKKVVLSIIENKPFEKFIKIFQPWFRIVDPIELDMFIIDLLTSNHARKRYIGLEIFDELSLNHPYHFSFNILELQPIYQYKLWVALTQDFHDPEKRLTALLPLIGSNNKLLKEGFLCKLEEISEDYGGYVIKILENNLDRNIHNHSIAIERIKKYIEIFFSKNVDLKRSISELNPYYTHYKFVNRFNELFSKKMSKSVEKGAVENSLLSVLGTNKIQLSKGGGWRIGSRKEISQLGKIEASFAMPRGYFINPNEFEFAKGFLTRQDWTDEEFSDINIILENE